MKTKYINVDKEFLSEQMNKKIVADLSIFYAGLDIELNEIQKITSFLLHITNKTILVNGLMSYLKGSTVKDSTFIMDDFKKSDYFTIFLNELLKEAFIMFESELSGKDVKLEDYQVGHYYAFINSFFKETIKDEAK
jgi:hypothetical protein